jgi:hypothetical protein
MTQFAAGFSEWVVPLTVGSIGIAFSMHFELPHHFARDQTQKF